MSESQLLLATSRSVEVAAARAGAIFATQEKARVFFLLLRLLLLISGEPRHFTTFSSRRLRPAFAFHRRRCPFRLGLGLCSIGRTAAADPISGRRRRRRQLARMLVDPYLRQATRPVAVRRQPTNQKSDAPSSAAAQFADRK